MKKYLSIEGIYKLFVILAVSVIVFALNNEVFAEGNPTEGNPTIKANPETENIIWTDEAAFEKWQFEQSQFLTRINNKTLVAEFLWLCDHSIYCITVKNWNSFIRNYKAFQQAYKDYNRGFNVQFDDLLD